MSDGTVYEEVIDMLVASGATVSLLNAIGFTDEQYGIIHIMYQYLMIFHKKMHTTTFQNNI